LPSKDRTLKRMAQVAVLALGLVAFRLSPLPHGQAAVHAAAPERSSAQEAALPPSTNQPRPAPADTATSNAAPATPEPSDVAHTNPYEDPSQCTARAWDLAAGAGHKLPRFGDGNAWRQAAIDHGYQVQDKLTEQSVNSVAVWDSYVGGTFDAGHVAWVTKVDLDHGRFYVQERNWSPGADSERWVDWEPGMSFIVFPAPPPAPPAAAPAPASAAASATAPVSPGAAAMQHKLDLMLANELTSLLGGQAGKGGQGLAIAGRVDLMGLSAVHVFY
jgi:surface antigen